MDWKKRKKVDNNKKCLVPNPKPFSNGLPKCVQLTTSDIFNEHPESYTYLYYIKTPCGDPLVG